jgi:hypothetical protein
MLPGLNRDRGTELSQGRRIQQMRFELSVRECSEGPPKLLAK